MEKELKKEALKKGFDTDYDDYDLLVFVANRILDDRNGRNGDLISLYKGANEDQKALIDNVFVALCGYSLPSLVFLNQPAYVYDIEWGLPNYDLPKKVDLPDFIRDDMIFGPCGPEIIDDHLEKVFGAYPKNFKLSKDFREACETCLYEK